MGNSLACQCRTGSSRRRRNSEMSEIDQLNINDLPFEILCEIFDYLPLADVKKAAVVCRRWHQIIFSELYIKRFKLVLDLNELVPQLQEMHKILEKSDREYSSIVLKINLGHSLTDARLMILKSVIRMISQCSISLYFHMADLRLESCVSQVTRRARKLQLVDTRAKYIPLGMGLKEAMLAAICEFAPDLGDLVIADMNINNPKALETLSSLSQLKLLLISDYYPYCKPLTAPIVLPNLDNLSLINVTDDASYYFKADNLKRFFIHTNETDAAKTMQSIVDNVNNDIVRLCVHFSERSVLVDQIFEQLECFPNLKAFELGGVAVPADILKSLDPSNQLQHLIFVQCYMESVLLVDLKVKLKSLNELVFDSCFLFQAREGFRRIEYQDLEPLRRAMPACKVVLDYN